MEERQLKFLECIRKRTTADNRPLMETVAKAYALNEGLAGVGKRVAEKVASKVSGVARRMTADPARVQSPEDPKSVPDYPALRRAMLFEKDCWDRDINRFYQQCELVKYFVSNYGIKDFNEMTHSDYFKSAVAMGTQLDKIRKNPLIEATVRMIAFHDALKPLARGTDRPVMEALWADYRMCEGCTVELPAMLESREDNLHEFKNAMTGIANFIRRHGVYPWRKFLSENRLLLARAGRFDKKEDSYSTRECPSPSMAADIMRAYSSGSSYAGMPGNPALHEAAEEVPGRHEYPVGDVIVSMYSRPGYPGREPTLYVHMEVPPNGVSRNEWSVPLGPDLTPDSIRAAVKYVYRRIVAMAMWNATNNQELLVSDKLSLDRYSAVENSIMSSLDFEKMASDAKALS